MTFRARILSACLIAAAVPLVILAAGARHVVHDRLTQQHVSRVTDAADALRRELERSAATIDARLEAIARRITDDPDTRAALLGPQSRSALLDLAADAMPVAGLDYLLLLDEQDVILSSGHFRNDFGRTLPSLGTQLRRSSGPAVVAARRPTGPFSALVRGRSIELGGRRLSLAGGIAIDSLSASAPAASFEAVSVTFHIDPEPGPVTSSMETDAAQTRDVLPGTARASGRTTSSATAAATPGSSGRTQTADGGNSVTSTVRIPFIDAESDVPAGAAVWTAALSMAPLDATMRLLDRWFLIALGAALFVAFVVAQVVAARVTRPLEVLARNASRVELTRYDIGLATRRTDEIGSLSRLLDRMVGRLRTAAQQLRDVERRATVGDMARQVNHDIRNGLVPIRNVIRHLAEVAEEAPATLGTVFAERAGTLQSGIGYLENLATNYARLTPRVQSQPCDVDALLRSMLDDAAGGADQDRVTLDVRRPLPRAHADPVALRRVIENVMVNAIESLGDRPGTVTIRARRNDSPDDPRILIEVADTGSGIDPDALERIFDDFYTTKDRGTGLGLSIVRRLIADMGGRVQVQSEPGRGTTFTLELPADRQDGAQRS